MRLRSAIALGMLLLAACNSPQAGNQNQNPNPNGVIGFLDVTVSGLASGTGKATATAHWVNDRDSSSPSAQSIALQNTLPTFAEQVVQITDSGSSTKTRWFSLVLDITNSTAITYNNLTLYALNDPASSIGGTALVSMVNGSGAALTDPVLARSFLPTHGMRFSGIGVEVSPGNAQLQFLTSPEVVSVKGQLVAAGFGASVEPLQYGYVARNYSQTRVLPGAGCVGANCNKGYVSIGYRFVLPATLSNQPDKVTIRYAVGTDTTTIGSQSVEEQSRNLVMGRAATDGNTVALPEVRTLFGNTYTGANENFVCRVVVAGTLASPLVYLPSGATGTDCPAAGAPTDLLITEVGTNFFANTISWVELYNPTTSAINLSAYSLKTGGIPPAGGVITDPTDFTLPNQTIGAGQFIVVGGKPNPSNQFNNNKAVFVLNGALVPFWNANGCIELTKAAATVDYVRFGTCTRAPLTPTAWSGAAVAALPSSTNDYGRSIVRNPLTSDTNAAADWSLRDFVTPAAVNDVPAGAVDADNDGLPDSSEVLGSTYAGIDIYSMGARAGVRDIFIELDHMNSADLGVIPQKAALDKVVAAFAPHNIAMHFDAGNQFSASFSPANYNLGNGSNTVPLSTNIALGATAGFANLYEIKAANFDYSRLPIFHYMLFATSQDLNGICASSGIAELPGNDAIVSLGSCGLNTSSASNTNLLNNFQAATVMHEFGHNLNLRHGGNENQNYKPNYISTMNYEFQLNGIGPVTGVAAGDRYYYTKGFKGMTFSGLTNSAFTTTFIMDYSNGSSTALNENAINENNGLGRGAAFVDFNNNNVADVAAVFDTNSTGTQTTLTDFNDWGNVLLPFTKNSVGYLNGAPAILNPTPITFSPASTDQQPASVETPLKALTNR